MLIEDSKLGGNARVTVDLARQVVIRPNGEEIAFEIDPFTIPVEQKAQLLIDANTEAMKVANVKFVNSFLFFIREDRNYANTDGSMITQTVIRSWVPFTATAVSPDFSDL